MNVFVEALLVGIITAVIGIIISTSLMFFQSNFDIKTYTFWPQVMLSFFITGMLIHLILEVTNMNYKYCKNKIKC